MSELSDKALYEIQKAVDVKVITDKEGREWSTRALFLMRPEKEPRETLPAPNKLAVFTLTGLVDFCLRYAAKKGPEDPAIIHILSYNCVTLASEPFGPTLQRTEFVTASFERLLGSSFKFGEFYDQEAFIVGLQSLFEPTPARADVLRVIGTIKENQVRSFADDGVTQSVAASAGQVLVSEVQVPNPVFLKPYRTFREIDQPDSPFILRVRPGKEKPQCALFEADGGRWKLTAIQRIKEYLEDKIEIPIFA